MRLPTEYLSMGPIQRKKAVADDLSAALRSMCQSFKQPIKFHWKYAGKLKQYFLRPRATPSVYKKTKTAMNSEPKSEGHRVSEKRGEQEMVAMNIPADTDMATDLRAYSQWPGNYEPR